MTHAANRSAIFALAIQGIVAMLALGYAIVAPPASGRMLMLPLAGGSADRLVTIALGANLRILGRGPVAGSLIVDGTSVGLNGMTWRHDILLTTAVGGGCKDPR